MTHINFCKAELCMTPVGIGQEYCVEHSAERWSIQTDANQEIINMTEKDRNVDDTYKGGIEQRGCESYRDCDLPTETYENPDDEVVCPDCGRVWEYSDGWFNPTDRYVDTETNQEE